MQYETKHKLVFGSNKQVFSLRGVKSKKISSRPGRHLLKSVLKVGNAWVETEWVEREEELSVICTKVVVKEREKIRVLREVVYLTKVEGQEQRLGEHHKRKYESMKRDDK